MQTLYIADLPLLDEPDKSWGAVEAVIDDWAVQRLALDLRAADGTNQHSGEQGTWGRSLQRQRADDSARLRRWQTRRVDPARPLWAYDVTAWLWQDRADDPDMTCLRVRLSAHALHGRVAELPHPPGPPGIVRTLLDQYDVITDGKRLGHPVTIDAPAVPGLVQHLIDPGRRRPVLVLSPAPTTGRPAIDPVRTTYRLGGLAHVVVLADRATTYALTDALGGPSLSVFGGAVRLYWPYFEKVARRNDHPLWLAGRLTAHGPHRFDDLLFARLGRLSALTLGPPNLDDQLRQEESRIARAVVADKLAAVTRQHNDALRELEQAQTTAKVATPVDDVPAEDWFAEHDSVMDELERTANERDELQVQYEESQSRLAAAEANIKAMAMATVGTEPAVTEEDDDDEFPVVPTSVRQAVEIAATECPHLDFLPEAFTSAGESEYPRPRRVLDDLTALDKVAAAWARNGLPAGGFEPALVEAGVSGFRSGISHTARQQYDEDYQRTHAGKVITLGPHIAHGVGPPTTIMRIYWYADDDARTLVIGHVGRKLRDGSNS